MDVNKPPGRLSQVVGIVFLTVVTALLGVIVVGGLVWVAQAVWSAVL